MFEPRASKEAKKPKREAIISSHYTKTRHPGLPVKMAREQAGVLLLLSFAASCAPSQWVPASRLFGCLPGLLLRVLRTAAAVLVAGAARGAPYLAGRKRFWEDCDGRWPLDARRQE